MHQKTEEQMKVLFSIFVIVGLIVSGWTPRMTSPLHLNLLYRVAQAVDWIRLVVAVRSLDSLDILAEDFS